MGETGFGHLFDCGLTGQADLGASGLPEQLRPRVQRVSPHVAEQLGATEPRFKDSERWRKRMEGQYMDSERQ